MSRQYLRKASLVVANESDALELSELRVTFSIKQSDFQTPNVASFTIWNPRAETVSKVIKEFTRVVFQAGYQDGPYGILFDGTIKQFKRGKASPTETYLTVYAADADLGLNFAVVNTSLAAGAKPEDVADALGTAFADKQVTAGYVGPFIGGVLPRGKVLFGLARDHARRLAETNAMSFSAQDGKYQYVPIKGYVPGPPVVLNSLTGMIGIPEATNDGVEIRCLLNPEIKVGRLVQIDNKSIVQTTVREQGFPQYTALTFPASVTDDGFYRSLVVEHDGDTRGNDWYTDLTCLAVDKSVAAAEAVKT